MALPRLRGRLRDSRRVRSRESLPGLVGEAGSLTHRGPQDYPLPPPGPTARSPPGRRGADGGRREDRGYLRRRASVAFTRATTPMGRAVERLLRERMDRALIFANLNDFDCSSATATTRADTPDALERADEHIRASPHARPGRAAHDHRRPRHRPDHGEHDHPASACRCSSPPAGASAGPGHARDLLPTSGRRSAISEPRPAAGASFAPSCWGRRRAWTSAHSASASAAARVSAEEIDGSPRHTPPVRSTTRRWPPG